VSVFSKDLREAAEVGSGTNIVGNYELHDLVQLECVIFVQFVFSMPDHHIIVLKLLVLFSKLNVIRSVSSTKMVKFALYNPTKSPCVETQTGLSLLIAMGTKYASTTT
jgi:hypothetical protein